MWCVARWRSVSSLPSSRAPRGDLSRPRGLGFPSCTAPSLEAPPVVLSLCSHVALHEFTPARHSRAPAVGTWRLVGARARSFAGRGEVVAAAPLHSAPAGPSGSGPGRRVPRDRPARLLGAHPCAASRLERAGTRPPLGFQAVFPAGPRLVSSLRGPRPTRVSRSWGLWRVGRRRSGVGWGQSPGSWTEGVESCLSAPHPETRDPACVVRHGAALVLGCM